MDEDIAAWKPGEAVPADIAAAEAESARRARHSTDRIGTPERLALRSWIINEVAAERVAQTGSVNDRDRRAAIIVGLPAAGKSSVADPLARRMRALVIDADDMKAKLPEFDGGVGAAQVHEESADMANRLARETTRTGYNVILPIVGGNLNRITARIRDLKAAGYHVTLIHTDLPLAKTGQRNMQRFRATGRLVPMDYLIGLGDRPRENYIKPRSEADDHAEYSNDVPRGSPPRFGGGSGDPLYQGGTGPNSLVQRSGGPGNGNRADSASATGRADGSAVESGGVASPQSQSSELRATLAAADEIAAKVQAELAAGRLTETDLDEMRAADAAAQDAEAEVETRASGAAATCLRDA